MEQEYLKKYLPEEKLEEGLKQLEKGIPVQYIVGNVNFYGNTINVDSNVLIPRFETEELIEKTIYYISNLWQKKIRIADLGTGSGCIAITLKKKVDCTIDAVDVSAEALLVARENAKLNQTDINFYQGDMLKPLVGTYDVIISNPPYIKEDEEIDKRVYDYEPHLALFAQDNGLFYYEEILKNVNQYLNSKFLIAFEIGDGQGKYIKKMASKYLDNVEIKIENDMQGRERFVFICKQV